MNYAQLLEYLEEQEPFFLEGARDGRSYCCPSCGNGSGDDGTGLAPYKDRRTGKQRYKCFVCDEGGGDLLDLVGQAFNLASFEDQVAKACDLYGVEADGNGQYRTQTPPPQRRNTAQDNAGQPRSRVSSLEDFQPIESSKRAVSYMQGRGFNLSFLREMNLRAEKRGNGFPNIVIPYPEDAEGYYFKRGTDPERRFMQPKEGSAKRLFNPAPLCGEDPVFITEGEIDALAIMQQGGRACALSSVAQWEKLKEAQPSAPLLLCLDNDSAGQECARKLLSAFPGQAQAANVAGGFKDPAERLQKDPDGLAQAIAQAVANAEKEEEKPVKEKTLNELTAQLFASIEEGKYKPVKTGVKALDELLEGGLISKTLVSISAAPGVGKTIIAQAIADSLARQGYPVLYACLEMSAEQMAARSISRESFNIQMASAISVNEIFKGAQIRRDVLESMARYGDNVTYTDTVRDIDGIIKTAQDIEQRTGKAPYIFVDYVQLLQDSATKEKADRIERALIALKNYVNSKGVIAFAVVADNREAAKTGKSNLFSGRDTSALEYSADYTFSLSFTRALRKGADVDEIRHDPDQKREVTLFVEKARYGEEGGRVDLTMWGEYAAFMEKAPRRAAV